MNVGDLVATVPAEQLRRLRPSALRFRALARFDLAAPVPALPSTPPLFPYSVTSSLPASAPSALGRLDSSLVVLKSRLELAHPNGPMATNKAAALAKFLERKLQQPGGLNSLDPVHLEIAVNNAKATVNASNGRASSSGVAIRHVSSFGGAVEPESDRVFEIDNLKETRIKKKKKKKKNKVGKKTRDQDRGSKMLKKKKRKKVYFNSLCLYYFSRFSHMLNSCLMALQNLKAHKCIVQKQFKS
ncbi:hypothetical protein AXF42_Ash016701 [Apostasia shenzhenica]|uniref:Uncharacterized protein n=1 Tax=Apostasia shenzhenica TaxID=1088818 RepID=A0A2I0AQ49_9ASPA|nr:hypothetical protein AXF42_Ash016701 [Apostasia shenzhenica]